MSDELSSPSSLSPCAQLSIIVDLTSSSFDFKTLYNHLSSQSPPNSEHHHWHFGGLRSYTIPFQSNLDETTINQVINKLKLLQNHLSILPPFWISYKQCQIQTQQLSNIPLGSTSEVIRKNVKLGKFYANNGLDIEYTGGALVELNKYIWDVQTQIREPWRLVFYHDKIDLDYGCKEKKLRKTLKAEMIDRCAIIMTQKDGFTLFINMNGNLIDYEAVNSQIPLNTTEDSRLIFNELKLFLVLFFFAESEPSSCKPNEPSISYIRTAPRESQPYYSTIRLVISLSNHSDHIQTSDDYHCERLQRLNSCYTQFIEFFQRNHINDCFGVILSIPSTIDCSSLTSLFLSNECTSFIKQYCWQMLMSIGYRFQQRLTTEFIQQMNLIDDDDEFYQVEIHLCFIDLLFCLFIRM